MYFQALREFGTQKNQSERIDYMLSSNIKVRTETSLEQVRRIELPSQPWQGRILATEPHLRCLCLYYIKKNLKNQLKLGCDLPFFYGKMFLIKDRRLEMKKKNKILIILLLLLLAGGIGFGVYYIIVNF